MKKLLVGPLLIVLGLAAVACGGSPTLLPTGTAAATPPASAAAGISSTPPASPAAAVGSTPAASSSAAHGLLLSAGTYAVGDAIPAGTYQGQPLNNDSHYQIATDANGKNIVTKSPRLTGQFALTLIKGQYLVVSGVMRITKLK